MTLFIIKLGGAAITDKTNNATMRKEIIDRISREISVCSGNLIIVHGAGSFGHTIAKKYHLTNGTSTNIELNKQLRGLSEIRVSMRELNTYISKQLHKSGSNPFPIDISSLLITNRDNVQHIDFRIVNYALENNQIPIFHGDMCFDESTSFRVVSGDRIIYLLIKYLKDLQQNDIHVIFGTDIDGLYDRDPSLENAKLIEKIKFEQIDDMINIAGGSSGIDVTEGMKGKLIEIKKILKMGVGVTMINITVPGRLQKLLTNEKVISSAFYPQ